MDDSQIAAYLIEKERVAYQHTKELQKTLRWAILAILWAITIIACSYMYLVVPVEDDITSADNGSQIIQSSAIGGNNGM